MSIFHDAYLFKPEEFVAAVRPYVDRLQASREGYSFLRSAAISIYDNNPWVRKLAGEYGGWDRNAIVTEIPADQPESPEDIAFWVVIFLYHHLFEAGMPLGLGNNWHIIEKIVSMLGWNDCEKNLLIKGHNFKELAQEQLCGGDKSFDSSDESLSYWSSIHPFSTGGHAGWIDLNDVQRLTNELSKGQSQLPSLKMHENNKPDIESMQEVYQLATKMLATAQKEGCGLCLIMSG
jgi:hypothetical protein